MRAAFADINIGKPSSVYYVRFHMPLPRRSQVSRATQRTPWHLSNEVLYKLCHEHPFHVETEVVLAKVLLIGRVYAAAIERRRSKNEENDDFYISNVAPKIIKSSIDQWIELGRRVEPESAEALDVMVEVHGQITRLFRDISGLDKRALASKYLHFHVPRLFFIYDTRAVEGLRTVSDVVGRASPYSGDADSEYRKFTEKCARLRRYCEAEFGMITKVKVYSPTRAHRESFAEEMTKELGIPVEPFDRAEPVVRGSDIVATCTDSNKLVVTDPNFIEKGMHLANCSSKEFSWDIVKRCDIVIQVGTETFGAKGGMAESERHHGWASWVVGSAEQQARIPKRPVSNLDFVDYPTLTDLLNDPAKRRSSAEQITFFHNLGLLGFQFAAVAAKAYNLAREKGVGLEMSTDPLLQDIRD